ncbi:MAG: protein translocase subunit SecD, partial [Paracoccaceae bacterium]
MLQIALWKRLVIWFLCIGGLLLALPNAFYSRVESFNDAKLTSETAEGWPSFLPSSLVNLGLDLRGGAHLLAEVQVADVYEQRMAALWPEVRDLLRNERAKVGTIRLQKGEPNELKIKLSKPEAINDAVKLVETLAKPVSSIGSVGKLDLEVIGENSDLIVRLSEAERRATDDRTMQQALEIIRRRIDEVGTREPTIQRQGTERILIQVPGIGSASELKQLIGTTAQLTFQPVIAARVNSDSIAGSGEELLPSLENPSEFYLLDAGAVVTGEELVDAQPSFDQ